MITLLFLSEHIPFFSLLFSVFDFSKASLLRLRRHPQQLGISGLQRGERPFLLKNSSPGSKPGRTAGRVDSSPGCKAGRIASEVDFWHKDSRFASMRVEPRVKFQNRPAFFAWPNC
ncbi:hypothetical protein RB195_018968 [Necator americanus]|uniref:Uncharacterized protein n=1 Tax=Necator americanus TaxID=51031 RepID=A0ABR1CBZ4_NECAM